MAEVVKLTMFLNRVVDGTGECQETEHIIMFRNMEQVNDFILGMANAHDQEVLDDNLEINWKKIKFEDPEDEHEPMLDIKTFAMKASQDVTYTFIVCNTDKE